jgi:hypothetical protein
VYLREAGEAAGWLLTKARDVLTSGDRLGTMVVRLIDGHIVLEDVGIRRRSLGQPFNRLPDYFVSLVKKSLREDQYPVPRPPKMPSQSLLQVYQCCLQFACKFRSSRTCVFGSAFGSVLG